MGLMNLKIIGSIEHVETIAEGNGIRELGGLRYQFGLGNWKKKKGVAKVLFPDGASANAEIHCTRRMGLGRLN